MKAMMTAQDFRAWVNEAEPGDRCIYHQGSLMSDREPVADEHPEKADRAMLARLADKAFAASEAGHVDLCQQRLGKRGSNRFAYIAIRRARAW